MTTDEITADLILETAERWEIELRRGVYLQNNEEKGRCGCAIGVLAAFLDPSLIQEAIKNQDHWHDWLSQQAWEAVRDRLPLSLAVGLEDGFEGYSDQRQFYGPSYLRGYAVGCEVARRAGLENEESEA